MIFYRLTLAKSGSEPFSGKDWAFEEKWCLMRFGLKQYVLGIQAKEKKTPESMVKYVIVLDETE
jgi:hypothetical protein